jgi:pantoate--beta-alanine ligase
MQIISDIQQVHNVCQKWRDKGESIAFVPTMGCLHAGHLSLVKKAQSLADHVLVSIFVNPLQFDDVNDFSNYPHTLDEDILKLADVKVEVVFTPEARLFYPEGESQVKQVELGEITTILEGEQRPGHFTGVATVVKRFFDLIRPNFAIFGEKDFQQLMLIKQLVEKFTLDTEIISMPTFREQDGLAMSSRNVHLSEIERSKAPEIYRQLTSIKAAITDSTNINLADLAKLEQTSFEHLVAAGFVPDYVAIRETETLLAPQSHDIPKVILIAAKLGEIRLIDNIRV